jgi:hypothetical protein
MAIDSAMNDKHYRHRKQTRHSGGTLPPGGLGLGDADVCENWLRDVTSSMSTFVHLHTSQQLSSLSPIIAAAKAERVETPAEHSSAPDRT